MQNRQIGFRICLMVMLGGFAVYSAGCTHDIAKEEAAEKALVPFDAAKTQKMQEELLLDPVKDGGNVDVMQRYILNSAESNVSVAVVKNEDIVVNGHFAKTFGLMQQLGQYWRATAMINAKEYQSGVVQRDENVRKVFFGLENKIGPLIISLETGWVKMPLEFGKTLTDWTVTVPAILKIAKSKMMTEISVRMSVHGDSVDVRTSKPLNLSFAQFSWQQRIEKLKEKCGHKSIANSFDITFEGRYYEKSVADKMAEEMAKEK